MKTRKPKPTDATMRNVKASKKRDATLSARVKRLEVFAKFIAPSLWRRS